MKRLEPTNHYDLIKASVLVVDPNYNQLTLMKLEVEHDGQYNLTVKCNGAAYSQYTYNLLGSPQALESIIYGGLNRCYYLAYCQLMGWPPRD